ncbi:hypothetical protein CK203_070621 [Vitis vinifera]|uniref:Uncharacterized protein n=1 Tax=Vitis vinifera TaxID=29760 RepID=A0A438C1F8_VITVI|nr:hypothetical protein CK203_070621 [Vitis vinifera]
MELRGRRPPSSTTLPNPSIKAEADEVSGEGSTPSPAAPTYLVFCGGGGEGRSGIPNALLLAEFDFASNSLSDMPEV